MSGKEVTPQRDTLTMPLPGQIWREVDPRFTRHIKILMVAMGRVEMTLMSNSSGVWKEIRKIPRTANITRFNGQRGGYQYVEG
jgi:hypothetical protein